MLRSSLIILGCIIRTGRFILRGPRLLSLHSLAAFLFTHLGLGIELGLLRLHRISGLVVGIATSFTARCLQNMKIISRVQRLIHWVQK
jgi:hypothetical protein